MSTTTTTADPITTQQQPPQPKRERTEAQRLASRANGALSQGPTSAQGKANSSRNALRHGLKSRILVLANEDPDILDNLIQEYTDEYQPQSPTELDLVLEMAYSKWRQYRAWTTETAAINKEMVLTQETIKEEFERFDESIRTAYAIESLEKKSRILDLHIRADTRCNRQFHRALHALLSFRAKQAKNTKNEQTNLSNSLQPKESDPEPPPEPETAAPLDEAPEIIIAAEPPASINPDIPQAAAGPEAIPSNEVSQQAATPRRPPISRAARNEDLRALRFRAKIEADRFLRPKSYRRHR